jgi:hypothetical protein
MKTSSATTGRLRSLRLFSTLLPITHTIPFGRVLSQFANIL